MGLTMNINVKANVRHPKPTSKLVVSIVTPASAPVGTPVTETNPAKMTPFTHPFPIPGPGWYVAKMELYDGTTLLMRCHRGLKK
jgi:hypothetical protein